MPNTNKGGTEKPHGEQETEEDTNIIGKLYDKAFRDKAAAWTAAFTMVLAVFTYLLWKVSNDANQLSIVTQAASVSSIGPGVVKLPNPDGKTLRGYNVIFSWVNSGSSPTRTAELQSNIYMGTASPSKGLDFNQLPQERIITAVIAPHSAIQTKPGFISTQGGKNDTYRAGGRMRLLLVEDDTAIQQFLNRALTEAGYKVDAAGDARSAFCFRYSAGRCNSRLFKDSHVAA